MSGGNFDPQVAGVGTHTISYSYTETSTGCMATATDNVVVDVCIGIEEVEGEINIKLYPNPTSDVITLSISGIQESLELTVLNMEGQVIFSEKLPLEGAVMEHKLNFSNYPAGVYYVRLAGEKTLKVERVVVE